MLGSLRSLRRGWQREARALGPNSPHRGNLRRMSDAEGSQHRQLPGSRARRDAHPGGPGGMRLTATMRRALIALVVALLLAGCQGAAPASRDPNGPMAAMAYMLDSKDAHCDPMQWVEGV